MDERPRSTPRTELKGNSCAQTTKETLDAGGGVHVGVWLFMWGFVWGGIAGRGAAGAARHCFLVMSFLPRRFD